MELPNYLTCPLRNLHESQETTVRTGHRTTDFFQIGKEYIITLFILLLCRVHHGGKKRLKEAEAGIKISGTNSNSLRFAEDTTLKAESKEELKSLLLKVKQKSEKAGLKLNIKKTLWSWYPVPSFHGK